MLIVCFDPNVVAQERNRIAGTVVNAATNTPIASASIFISGTSSGTVTNAAGQFTITNLPPKGSYDLVVSSIGFNTIVYPFSTDSLPLNLRLLMTAKATELATVTVEPWDPNGWANWGRVFTESFIGTTAASGQCEIKNKNVVRFRYSRKTNTLIAVADEPLIIENRALGYVVRYQLEDFIYNMRERTLLYIGYTLFEDMSEKRSRVPKRWLVNRKNAYNGSIMHFMRALYNNRVKEEGFDVQRMVKEPNVEKERVKKEYASLLRRNIAPGQQRMIMRPGSEVRIVSDSSAYYSSILRQDDFKDVIFPALLTADSVMSQQDSSVVLFFPNYLHITYKNGKEEQGYLDKYGERRKPWFPRSNLVLLQGNPVIVEASGTYFPPQDLFSLGYWSWSEKVAHLLPVDYKPEEMPDARLYPDSR